MESGRNINKVTLYPQRFHQLLDILHGLHKMFVFEKSITNSEKSEVILINLEFFCVFVVVDVHPPEILLTHYFGLHHPSDDFVVYHL